MCIPPDISSFNEKKRGAHHVARNQVLGAEARGEGEMGGKALADQPPVAPGDDRKY